MAESRRWTTRVRLREPQTVPISDEDYRQAVAALAMMIDQWWVKEQRATCETSEAPAAADREGHS